MTALTILKANAAPLVLEEAKAAALEALPFDFRALFSDGTPGDFFITDKRYLFQDRAGTTPVTASGQPVRAVRGAVNGILAAVDADADYWDYTEIDGVGFVVGRSASKGFWIAQSDLRWDTLRGTALDDHGCLLAGRCDAISGSNDAFITGVRSTSQGGWGTLALYYYNGSPHQQYGTLCYLYGPTNNGLYTNDSAGDLGGILPGATNTYANKTIYLSPYPLSEPTPVAGSAIQEPLLENVNKYYQVNNTAPGPARLLLARNDGEYRALATTAMDSVYGLAWQSYDYVYAYGPGIWAESYTNGEWGPGLGEPYEAPLPVAGIADGATDDRVYIFGSNQTVLNGNRMRSALLVGKAVDPALHQIIFDAL